MRTIIITFCLILNTALISFAQDPDNNYLREKDISGPIKSLHETVFKADNKSDKIITGKKINNSFNYESKVILNQKGYKIEETRYNFDGKPSINLKYSYNEKQNCTEEDRYNGDGNLANKRLFNYKYDETGKLIEENWINDNGIASKAMYKYDLKGNIVEKSFFKLDGTLDWKTTSVYDSNNNIIENIDWNSKGKIDWRTTYKVNDKGKVVEETLYKRGTKFYIMYKTEYDSFGNKTKTNWCLESGKVYATWTYTYEFDKNNNWTKAIELNPVKAGFLSARDEYVILRQIEY